MKEINFIKMSGSGNDFIIIDNRNQVVSEKGLTQFITAVCRRKLSVGADGVILIEKSHKADFRWRFFNADGSPAEMCGNGARCVARFAALSGIAATSLCFETDAGVVKAEVNNNRVKVKMPDPVDLKLDYIVELGGGPRTVSSVNTGVPHVILIEDHIDRVEIVDLGREIRNHPDFAPAGTNVNFICRRNQDSIAIRTYERGVEDETLACGTGSIASALVCACKLDMTSPIHVQTRSGEYLTIFFNQNEDRFTDIYMQGGARIIYQGILHRDALQ
jgi:diaminopimelate epimerase